jgi:4-amino-4-deoxy-L-arabinose transferase-like glycosyltransferase
MNNVGTAPSSPVISRRAVTIIVFVAILISVVVKFTRTGSRELWLDETYSVFLSHLPLGQVIEQTKGDVHPPFYYLILWLWVRLAGDSEIALRCSTAVLAGLATVAMAFLARRLLGPVAACLAVSLFAFSPILFVYSLEVRMYMLSILVLVCLLIVHASVTSEERPGKSQLISYGVCAAALIYVHYMTVFVVAALFADWLLGSGVARRRLIQLVTTMLITAMLAAPWLPIMFAQRSLKNSMQQELSRSYSDRKALTFASPLNSSSGTERSQMFKNWASAVGFYPARSAIATGIAALPLLIALAGVAALLLRGDRVCRTFVLVTISVWAGAAFLDLNRTRYLLLFVPVLILALARSIEYWSGEKRFRRWAYGIGALVLMVYAAGFFRQATTPHDRPWRRMVTTLQQTYRPGDIVVFSSAYAQVPFDYFARSLHFHPLETGFPISIYEWWKQQPFKGWGGPIINRSDVDRFISGFDNSGATTLWLVLYETQYYDPHNLLVKRLSETGEITEVVAPSSALGAESLHLVRISRASKFQRAGAGTH